MAVQLSPEQEAQLSQIASLTGRTADELAWEAVDRYLTEEGRFRAGVQAGLDAAARCDFVPTSEVWARVERALKA
jgi:predicted transcriptional regulator